MYKKQVELGNNTAVLKPYFPLQTRPFPLLAEADTFNWNSHPLLNPFSDGGFLQPGFSFSYMHA